VRIILYFAIFQIISFIQKFYFFIKNISMLKRMFIFAQILIYCLISNEKK